MFDGGDNVVTTASDVPRLFLLQTIVPDTLFTLFGVYGDVIRVKIMYQKKHTALIQFTNSQQAYV